MADERKKNHAKPLNEDMDQSGPKSERFKDSPQRVYELWQEFRDGDPQRDKRESILRAYYNHPYSMTPEQISQCMLQNPSRTNFGILAFKVNGAKTSFMDMINEREQSYKVTSEWDSEDEEVEALRRKSIWSDDISYAFERYFIREWNSYLLNMELDVNDMLLFGKGCEMHEDSRSAFTKNVPIENVHPNTEAGILPEEWDSCAVDTKITFRQLWKKVRTKEEAERSGWDRSAVIDLMKRTEPSWSDYSSDQVVKAWETGQGMNSGCENREAHLVDFYAMEYDPDSNGNQLSRYVIPQTHVTENSDSTKNKEQGIQFLLRKPFHAKDMTRIFNIIVDNVGHGKFYNTPSFAESIYVACKTYDQKMNRIIDATELNSMLMLEGGDANSGGAPAQYKLHDRIHFSPGTAPIQHRFQLPVQDSMEVLNRVMLDMNRGVGDYEIGGTNPAGGKTPISAKQVEHDSSESSRIKGSALKRFNAQLTSFGRECYRRFTEETVEGMPEYDLLQKFEKYLKKRGVPEEAWHPDNVFIESNMTVSAGSQPAKVQSTNGVIELLNIVPRSEGQKRAIREGVAILKGTSNVDKYFPPEDELNLPSTEDWRIGQENEAMKSNSFKTHNAFVQDTDSHITHLFGSGKDDEKPIGHIKDASISMQEGMQLIEALKSTPETEHPVLMNKVAEVLLEVSAKSEHCKKHLEHLNADKSKKQFSDTAQANIAEIDRLVSELTNQFEEAQQARLKKITEQSEQGGGISPEDAAAIQIMTAKAQMESEQKQEAHMQKMQHNDQEHMAKTSRENERAARDLAVKQEDVALLRQKEAVKDLKTSKTK